MTHDEVFLNIPWLLVGRLDPAAEAAALNHVDRCASCQQEMRSQAVIRDAMLTPVNLEFTPGGSYLKLKARIDALQRSPAGGATESSARASAPPSMPRWIKPLLVGQIAAVLLVGVMLVWTLSERLTAPRFETATRSTPVAAMPLRLRLVIAPSATVVELMALLRKADAVIINGPNSQGAWTLALNRSLSQKDETDLLSRLRAEPHVLLAEPAMESLMP